MNDLSFTWDNIHITSKRIKPAELKNYIVWLTKVAHNSPCGRCKTHLLYYIATNPPQPGEDLFIWSWRLHNDVNARLNRPPITLIDAAKRYDYQLK